MLDCWAGLGSVGRLARQRGALVVDGWNPEAATTALARFLAAYRGDRRLSFFAGDLYDGAEESYDIVVAHNRLDAIAKFASVIGRITRRLALIALEEPIEALNSQRLAPLIEHFRMHSLIGWGGQNSQRWSVIAFAKDAGAFLPPDPLVASTIDLGRSKFRFYETFARKALLAENILRKTGIDRIREIVSQVPEDQSDLKRIVGGVTYWLRMMRGYLQYKDKGHVDETNIYVSTLRKTLEEYDFDPLLRKELAQPPEMTGRVELRFRDIDCILSGQPAIWKRPIRILEPSEMKGRHLIRHGRLPLDLYADKIDGHHRVFWAKFLGLSEIPCVISFV